MSKIALIPGQSMRQGHFPRELHDRVLAALEPPSWLVAGSLLDDQWTIRTDDPQGRRQTDANLDFTAPIAPGPVRLSDPEHEHDLLTAKLFVFHGLGTTDGWTTAATTTRISYRALLDVIRWREAIGLHRMSDLRPTWFNLYKDALLLGRAGLLPYRERVEAYVREVREGRESLPYSVRPRRLRTNEVAARLGLGSSLQFPNRTFWPVLTLLEELDPAAFRRTVKGRQLAGSDDEEGAELIEQRVAELLRPWEALWELRRYMAHDPIAFMPFSASDTRTSLARAITSKRSVPTPVPPPFQACYLINAALRMILEHEDLLKDLHRAVRNAHEAHPGSDPQTSKRRTLHLGAALERLRVGKKAVRFRELSFINIYSWRHARRGERRDGTDLRNLLFALLPAACAVVIASFSARRRMEIESLRDDCIFTDPHGGTFLTCWIQKSLRRLDHVPVPVSVIRTIKVLTWLSAEARAANRKRWLFNFQDPAGQGGAVDFKMNEAVQMFADYVKVPPLPDGTPWVFKAHQFRSFFATMYYHRFHYPSLTALSAFLHHFDPETTRGYVTTVVRGSYLRLLDEKTATQEQQKELNRIVDAGRERAHDFEEIRQNFIFETARATVAGEAVMTGYGGELWARDLAQLIERANLTSTFATSRGSGTTLDELLGAWVKGRWLEPHPDGHSFCKCGSDKLDLAVAACLKAKREQEGDAAAAASVKPDHTYAADLTCSECPHNVQLEANRRYWEAQLAATDAAARKGATSRQRAAAQKRQERITVHMERCFDLVDVRTPKCCDKELD